MPPRKPRRDRYPSRETKRYESTRHEVMHLYPKLLIGGILIIDIHGHWKGPRGGPTNTSETPDS